MIERVTRRSSSETVVESIDLSRRTFLLSSAFTAIVTGGYATDSARATADPVPETIVLSKDDLVGGRNYVEWHVDPQNAPLSRFLDSAIPGFRSEAGLVAGFVATASATGPTSVESAVFHVDEGTATIADAIDDWVRQEQVGTTTRSALDGDTIRWVSVSGSGVDVLRYDALPGESFAITTATGDSGTALGPREAVGRYAETVRNRAEAGGGT